MWRFFIGLGLGAVLTIYSFGFIGIGHGTAVPLAFTAFFIFLLPQLTGPITIVMAPFLWSAYFLLIPKFQSWRRRLFIFAVVFLLHLSAGTGLAIQDRAFRRAVSEDRGALLGFALLFLITLSYLVYFAVRGENSVRKVN
jgi:hypothetical protein